ncbi:hypothetical protein FRC10_009880, partial [Ceratobasidium sp. 414]
GIMEPTKTLIDSGSSRNFMDITYARRKEIPLIELTHPRSVIAIDGNETAEKIRFRANITFELQGRTFKSRFYLMPLGDTAAILGKEWLSEHNPDINWRNMDIRYRDKPEVQRVDPSIPTPSTEGKSATTKEIPNEFRDFADVFDAEKFKELPPHRKHDCTIVFKEGAEPPRPAKAYPMSPDQQKTLKEFIDQELKDGKIRPTRASRNPKPIVGLETLAETPGLPPRPKGLQDSVWTEYVE